MNNNRIVSDDREICKIFNKFFVNVIPNLNIPEFTGSDDLHDHIIGDSVQSFLYNIEIIQVSSKLRRNVNLERNLSSVSYQKMKLETF